MSTRSTILLLTLLLATLLLTASPALALDKLPRWWWTMEDLDRIAALEKKSRWQEGTFRVESAHWIVETEISKRFGVEAALFLDLFHDAFEKVLALEWKKRIKKKPTVVILPSVTRYIKKYKDGSVGHHVLRFDEVGRCLKLRAVVFARDRHEHEFVRFNRSVLLHEGAHLLLQRWMGEVPVPVWLGEGLATYFQFWDLKKPAFDNATNRYARSLYLLTYLESRKTEKREGHPIDRLLAFTKKTWNPDRMGPRTKAHYGLAESLIDTLFTSDEGEKLLRALLDRLTEIDPGDELLTTKQMERMKALWEEQISFLEEEMLPQKR